MKSSILLMKSVCFQNMVGEWQPPENSELAGPPRDNPVVGHVVQRLMNMVYPPEVLLYYFTNYKLY